MTVTIPRGLADRIRAYHQLLNMGSTPQDIARDLIVAALESPLLLSSVTMEAQRRAFNVTQRQLYNRISVALQKIVADLDDAILLGTSLAPAEDPTKTYDTHNVLGEAGL